MGAYCDGRWTSVATRLVERYDIKGGSSVLDVDARKA